MDFKNIKTIAVVGLSDNPDRASYKVAKYFLELGYTIIPVNPNIDKFIGLKAYKNISEIPLYIKIDMFDVFRKSDDALGVVQEIIASKRKSAIFLQENIVNEKAFKLAKDNGLEISMGLCLMKEHLAKVKPVSN